MNHHLPSHLITTQAHWDAMADAIGDDEATRLYGARPDRYNSAESVQGLYMADRAPRRVLAVVIGLSCVLALIVGYRASHREPRASVAIEPCALVETQGGTICR